MTFAVEILCLKPAARLEVVVGLLNDLVLDVAKGADAGSDEDEVELLVPVPLLGARKGGEKQTLVHWEPVDNDKGLCDGPRSLRILDEEMYVCRNSTGLDRRQIDAVDEGIGEPISHLQSPDARARAYVEDSPGTAVGRDRSKIPPATEEFGHDEALEVEAFLFGRVIGEAVGCIAALTKQLLRVCEGKPHTAILVGVVRPAEPFGKVRNAVRYGL